MTTAFSSMLIGRRKNLLIVDDSQSFRFVLKKLLSRLGFTVFEAGDGQAALDILASEDIPVVICDWEMPGMDGIEFCRTVRRAYPDDYKYILMLTSHDESTAIEVLFDAGADDYITKPPAMTALRARLLGALRIVSRYDDLRWFNRELQEKKDAIDKSFASIRDDLLVAETIQRQYLPNDFDPIGAVRFAGEFLPAFHTSGDIFNYVPINETQICLFSADVSGHGVASALLAITIGQTLCFDGDASDATFVVDRAGKRRARDPAEVVDWLNQRFANGQTDHYFTITYCVLDLETSALRYCQAGHCPIIRVNAAGEASLIGAGGLPVGMLPTARYETCTIDLEPGDRIYLYSDGISEAENETDDMYGPESMMASLSQSRTASLEGSIERLLQAVQSWQAAQSFLDDVSIISFEYQAA